MPMQSQLASRATSKAGMSGRRRVFAGSLRTGTVICRSSFRRLITLRQRKDGQRAAEGGVVAQTCIAADRAEAFGGIGQTCCKSDPRPTADAGQDGDVLLAVVAVGHHVADDA